MKNILEGNEDLNEENYMQLMQEWQNDGMQAEKIENMMSEWGKAWEMNANEELFGQ